MFLNSRHPQQCGESMMAKRGQKKDAEEELALGPLPKIAFSDISTNDSMKKKKSKESLADLDDPPLPPKEAMLADEDDNHGFVLPELPNDIESRPKDSSIITAEEEHKKKASWLKRLFSKDKAEEAQQPSKAIPKKAEEPESPSLMSPYTGEKEQAENDDILRPNMVSVSDAELDAHQRRYAHYLDGLKRRLDHEVRERTKQLSVVDEELKQRGKELDAMEERILNKELDLMEQSKQYKQIKKLEHELEDKQITSSYQADQLKVLKRQLQEKEDKLRTLEKKGYADDRVAAQEHDALSKEKERAQHYEEQLREEDEAIAYLSDQMQAQKDHFERELAQLKHIADTSDEEVSSNMPQNMPQAQAAEKRGHQVSSKEKARIAIESEITKAYSAIDQSNVKQAKELYHKARASYAAYKKQHGEDIVMYHKLLELYDDIGLAELA
jgi:hypothetical protein